MHERVVRPVGGTPPETWVRRRFLLVAACSLVWGCSRAAEPDPPAEVRRILQDDRYEWVTIETEHARIHYPESSYAATHADELPGRAERARQSVLDRLSLPDYPELLHLFYVDDREDMANLTGRPVTGFSYSADAAIVVVFNEKWRPFETHELTHVVSMSTWPDPAGPAVVEGLAALVDGSCGGQPIGRLARTLLDRGEMIPLSVLTRDFRHQDDLVAYLEAANLIEFVLDRAGPGAIPVLWTGGLAGAPEVVGLSGEAFEPAWTEWLISSYDPASGRAWDAIEAGGCGISATSKNGSG
jgi:hypothetical protein